MFYKPSYSSLIHYEMPTPSGVVMCRREIDAEELAIFILERQFIRHFGTAFNIDQLRISKHKEPSLIKLYSRFYLTGDTEYGPSLTYSRIISLVHLVNPPRPWTVDAVLYWNCCGVSQKAEEVLTSVARELFQLLSGKTSLEKVVWHAVNEWNHGAKARAVETICSLIDLGAEPSLSGVPEMLVQSCVQAQLSGSWVPAWDM